MGAPTGMGRPGFRVAGPDTLAQLVCCTKKPHRETGELDFSNATMQIIAVKSASR